ncbi:MAG: hypothetical protein IPN76_22975 [Saprospiraceae bacterium]|nr:hypothetical protein [Saprospiraceae bacterium]
MQENTTVKTNYLQEDLKSILFDGLNLSGVLEETLWDAANHLRSNSTLKASEYATPIMLGDNLKFLVAILNSKMSE